MRKPYLFTMTLLLAMTLGLASCGNGNSNSNNENQQWEYLVKRAEGMVMSDSNEEFKAKRVIIEEEDLDELGAQGWELVNTYEETETVFPNWGNEKYVTGIQPNTRTLGIVLIFKRPATSKKADSDKKQSDDKK